MLVLCVSQYEILIFIDLSGKSLWYLLCLISFSGSYFYLIIIMSFCSLSSMIFQLLLCSSSSSSAYYHYCIFSSWGCMYVHWAVEDNIKSWQSESMISCLQKPQVELFLLSMKDFLKSEIKYYLLYNFHGTWMIDSVLFSKKCIKA